MRLKGQVALITGGGTGIDRAIALAFTRAGGPVVAHDSKSRDETEDVVGRIEAGGGQAAALRGDVSKEAASSRSVRAATGPR